MIGTMLLPSVGGAAKIMARTVQVTGGNTGNEGAADAFPATMMMMLMKVLLLVWRVAVERGRCCKNAVRLQQAKMILLQMIAYVSSLYV